MSVLVPSDNYDVGEPLNFVRANLVHKPVVDDIITSNYKTERSLVIDSSEIHMSRREGLDA